MGWAEVLTNPAGSLIFKELNNIRAAACRTAQKRWTDMGGFAQRWADAFNSSDLAGMESLYIADCEVVEVDNVMRGAEAMKSYFGGYLTAFPDGKITVLSSLESADAVAAECRYAGTNTGPLNGPQGEVPPTNRDVDFSFAVFFKLNEQRIATHHGYFDRMLFLRQLGLT